tara:strand:- start:17 stop:331 length:315 start_codon:yes stop_codon:yes gene_type:complete
MKTQLVEFWVNDNVCGGRRLGVAVYFSAFQVLIERGYSEPYLTENEFRAHKGKEARRIYGEILDGEVESKGDIDWSYEESAVAKGWLKGQEGLDLVDLLAQKPL